MARRNLLSLGRRWHRQLDSASGALLLFLAAFAPWGAGGTLRWASWILIGTGSLLGLLLVAKHGLTRFTGYEPSRWNRPAKASPWPTRILAVLTGLLLLQVGISVLNARAEVSWNNDGFDFLYRETLSWLPTTYDLAATRKAFFRYLGFAGAFFALRDWLQVKSRTERHREEDGRAADDLGRVPDRLRWLAWTLSINTAILALVGILHRLDGSMDLLWLVTLPQADNASMFASYPYRANAAQFINLVWPVTLGFWWALRTEALRSIDRPSRAGGQAHPLLLLAVAIMVGGVFVAGSRAGLAVAIVEMGLALLILGQSMRGWQPRVGLAVAFLSALTLGWTLAGSFLMRRFTNTLVDESASGRTHIWSIARRMCADFPLWGSGAETFLTLNGLYRTGAEGKWHGYVHDDWLETRLTFGWIGFALILALLVVALLSRWTSGALPIVRPFTLLLGVGLLGMLAHARIDFPFQIPSLHLLFLFALALFSTLGPHPLPTGSRRLPQAPDPS